MNKLIAALIVALSLPVFAQSSGEGALDFMRSSKIKAFKEVPNTGMKMIEGEKGVFFISENGRYSVKGRLFDNWRSAWVDDVDALTRTELVSLDDLRIDREELALFSVGRGERVVDVFVDPNCPYCREVINDAAGLLDDFTFNFILVPVISKNSARDVKTLWCAESQRDALVALAKKSWGGLKQKSDCDLTAVQKNTVLANMIGVAGVPYLIRWDGEFARGKPASLEEFLSSGEDIAESTFEDLIEGK